MSIINVKSFYIQNLRDFAKRLMAKYSLTIFFVKEGFMEKKIKPIILGISRDAILRMEIDTLVIYLFIYLLFYFL
jgi:hypothetical protein